METKNIKLLKKHLIGKKIVDWSHSRIKLSDGTIVLVKETDQDCCASAGGGFENVTTEIIITDVALIKDEIIPGDNYEAEHEIVITLFHEEMTLANINMHANNGNGGYYFSTSSIVADGVRLFDCSC